MAVIAHLRIPADSFELGRILSVEQRGMIELENMVPLGEKAVPFFSVSDAVRERFEAVVAALEAEGARCEPVSVPTIPDTVFVWNAIGGSGAELPAKSREGLLVGSAALDQAAFDEVLDHQRKVSAGLQDLRRELALVERPEVKDRLEPARRLSPGLGFRIPALRVQDSDRYFSSIRMLRALGLNRKSKMSPMTGTEPTMKSRPA
jgi:Asp-tRNA(Asn)/Glu-tRNA(Gln) amidotransferase A subunit family amidase